MTHLNLSDKAASAHVEAMGASEMPGRLQMYEPTGVPALLLCCNTRLRSPERVQPHPAAILPVEAA